MIATYENMTTLLIVSGSTVVLQLIALAGNLGFNSQPPHGGLQSLVSPLPGAPTPFSSSLGNPAFTWYICTQAGKTLRHIKIKRIFEKREKL